MRSKLSINRNVALVALVAGLMVPADRLLAHDQIPGAPQRRPIAIMGGTVHRVDGPAIKNGIVVFDAGKITAVGRNVEIPKNAKRIDAEGKQVYPGLIESMSDIGLREILSVGETIDDTEYGANNPNVAALSAVNPDSELIPVARSNGVLLALTAPGGRWMRGRAAVIQLDGWNAEEMQLLNPAALVVSWRAMLPRDDTAAGRLRKEADKMEELDRLLDSVRRYAVARKERPAETPVDQRLESLIPVVDGTLPMIAEANSIREIESAVGYAQRQGLRLTIYGGYDAVECAAILRSAEVPVIVGSIYRLPLRRHDPYDAPYTLPARLQEAGIPFAIAGEGRGYPGGSSNARNLPYHAATAAAYGLDRDRALRSITLSAAEILGVEDRVGSLSIGKDATLFVADGDVLETETHVTEAFIQGRQVDLNNRHKMLRDKYQRRPR